MRNLLIATLLLLQLILGYFYYTDYSKCCTSAPTEDLSTGQASSTGNDDYALAFKWNDDAAVTGTKWPAYRDSILSALGSDKKLEITGVFYEGEAGDNLSQARARSVRALFSDIPDDRILFKGQKWENTPADTSGLFEAASFSITSPEAKIKVEATRTLIYFGSNSTERIRSAEVEKYLDDIADRAATTGAKITLIGHTDNIGPDAANLKLGMQRAETVKRYLISKGVPASSITTQSKGEAEPIADNTTEEGRAQNRRTELIIK